MMYENFVKDFAIRTQKNYNALSEGPYEVTQLINSAVGLLIIPKEKFFAQIDDSIISSELLDRLKNCIVHRQDVEEYDEKGELKDIVKHIRNSIAHGCMEFNAEQDCKTGKTTSIDSVSFKDTNKKYKSNSPQFFEIKIPISLLREFFFAFADAVSNLEQSKNKHKRESGT